MRQSGALAIRARLVLLLAALLLPAACDKRPRSIAFVVPTEINPFFAQMREGAEAAAASQNVPLIFQGTAGGVEDKAGQVDLVQSLLLRHPAVMCLVPADSKAILPAVVSANKASVPIINIDNRIDSAEAVSRGAAIAAYIGSDNHLGGRLAGEQLATALGGKGDIALLEGLVGSDAAVQRAAGFREAIAKYPGLKLVASEAASWSREEGLNKFRTMLLAHPTLTGVFAANDEMALGAIKALAEGGSKAQKARMVIVGFDATPDGLAAVTAGTMNATVAQQPREMGKACVEAAIALMSGQQPDSRILVPVAVQSASDSSKRQRE